MIIQEDHQWVSIGATGIRQLIPKSPKRDFDGHEIVQPLNSEIEVTSVAEMETELLQVQARILLAERDIGNRSQF